MLESDKEAIIPRAVCLIKAYVEILDWHAQGADLPFTAGKERNEFLMAALEAMALAQMIGQATWCKEHVEELQEMNPSCQAEVRAHVYSYFLVGY